MELVHLDVAVLVRVNLVEAVLQGDATLDQNLHQVVKYLVLGILDVLLPLNLGQSLYIVELIELLELLVGNDSILVAVNLIEQSADFLIFDRQVEQSRKTQMEVSQTQVAIVEVVHASEGKLGRHRLSNLDLNGAEHLHFLCHVFKLALDLPVRLSDVLRNRLLQDWHYDGFLVLLVIIFWTCTVGHQVLCIDLFVGVRCPEPCQELSLGHVRFL